MKYEAWLLWIKIFIKWKIWDQQHYCLLVSVGNSHCWDFVGFWLSKVFCNVIDNTSRNVCYCCLANKSLKHLANYCTISWNWWWWWQWLWQWWESPSMRYCLFVCLYWIWRSWYFVSIMITGENDINSNTVLISISIGSWKWKCANRRRRWGLVII